MWSVAQIELSGDGRSGGVTAVNVLVLAPYPGIRGPIGALTLTLVHEMRRRGVGVSTVPWGRHTDAEGLLAKVAGRVADVRRIRRVLKGKRFDVLLVMTAHDPRALLREVPLLAATRGLCECRIVQFHGSLSQAFAESGHLVLKVVSKWLAHTSDAILLLSSEEAHDWEAFAPRRRYLVVANPYVREPVLGETYAMDDERHQDSLVVLFVGRLIAAKGIYDLVEAMDRVRRRVPCMLVIAGDGEDRETLVELIRSKGMCNCVSLTGHLERAELLRSYRRASVFVLPSHSEGFPTVLSEAMDAGLPIVTTGIRGALDHLVDQENALLVPPRRVDLLAEAILRLLRDPELRRIMSSANKEKVTDFAPDRVAAHYVSILADVLERTRVKARA